VTEPLYTRGILRLAASIPHLVPFAELEDAVRLRSPTCGSQVAMAVTLDAQGRVTSLSQAVEACAFGQAAAALVGNEAVGAALDQAQAAADRVAAWLDGKDAAVDAWPGLAVLDPARHRRGRHGAILLPFRALAAAIEAAR
jgi:NifU-like protein involved in Fe-S cluster formation